MIALRRIYALVAAAGLLVATLLIALPTPVAPIPVAQAQQACSSWKYNSNVVTIRFDSRDYNNDYISVPWQPGRAFPDREREVTYRTGLKGKASGGVTGNRFNVEINWYPHQTELRSPTLVTGVITPVFDNNPRTGHLRGTLERPLDGPGGSSEFVGGHWECADPVAAPDAKPDSPPAAPPVQCPPGGPQQTVPAGQTCPPPSNAIRMTFDRRPITWGVTVTNSAGIPGNCTYVATPTNGNIGHRQSFDIAANGTANLTVPAPLPLITYQVVVTCTGSYDGRTVELGKTTQNVSLQG